VNGFKFTNLDDETRFTVGEKLWSPDGKQWFRGEPPPAPDNATMFTVTGVDRKTGTITVDAK